MEAYEQILAALADPTRRAVIEELRGGPKSVQALADGLPVSRPAVSQHLKVLKQAGLVMDTAAGTRRIYHLEASGFKKLKSYLETFWADALTSFQKHVETQSKEEQDQ